MFSQINYLGKKAKPIQKTAFSSLLLITDWPLGPHVTLFFSALSVGTVYYILLVQYIDFYWQDIVLLASPCSHREFFLRKLVMTTDNVGLHWQESGWQCTPPGSVISYFSVIPQRLLVKEFLWLHTHPHRDLSCWSAGPVDVALVHYGAQLETTDETCGTGKGSSSMGGHHQWLISCLL